MNTEFFRYVRNSFLIPGGEVTDGGIERNGEIYLVSPDFIVRFLYPEGLVPDQVIDLVRRQSDRPHHQRRLLNGRALLATSIDEANGHMDVPDADESEPLFLTYIDPRKYRAHRLQDVLKLFRDCYFTGPRARLTDMMRRGQSKPVYDVNFDIRQAEHLKRREMTRFGSESPKFYAFELPQHGKSFTYLLPGVATDMFSDMEITLSAPGHIPDELRTGEAPPAVAYDDQVVVLIFSPDDELSVGGLDQETGLYVSPRNLAWCCDAFVNAQVERCSVFFSPMEDDCDEDIDERISTKTQVYKEMGLYVSYRRWVGDSEHDIEQQIMEMRRYFSRKFVSTALKQIERVLETTTRTHKSLLPRMVEQAQQSLEVLHRILGPDNIPLTEDQLYKLRSLTREI